jgi:hypothetical protein
MCQNPKVYFRPRSQPVLGLSNNPAAAGRGPDVANACKKDLQTEGNVGQAAIPPRDVPRSDPPRPTKFVTL